jgi:NTE family protein
MDPSDAETKADSSEGLTAHRGIRSLWERLQDWIRRLGRAPKIGVALGSGAAWGVAHIGVLSAFRDLKIPIAYLSGSSAGSFVGALYAGGVEGRALEACGREYRWRDAGRLRYLPKMGLATNDRMAEYLKKRIGHPDFQKLRIPFYVVATDLISGEPRVFNEGPVIPAVRASCAIPGIFEPVEIEGRLYCDGGLLDPVPCEILRKAGAELVIGVELANSNKKRPASLFEVIHRAHQIVLHRPAQSGQQAADLMIRPRLHDLHEFGFDQNEALIERGNQAALEQLRQWPQFHRLPDPSKTEPTP